MRSPPKYWYLRYQSQEPPLATSPCRRKKNTSFYLIIQWSAEYLTDHLPQAGWLAGFENNKWLHCTCPWVEKILHTDMIARHPSMGLDKSQALHFFFFYAKSCNLLSDNVYILSCCISSKDLWEAQPTLPHKAATLTIPEQRELHNHEHWLLTAM